MKYFTIFLILIGFAGLTVSMGFAPNSYALTLGMSSEEILNTQKLVILGHVDSVETRPDKTEYAVSVLEYVKSPDEFEKKNTITIIGCAEGQMGGCVTFDKGQDVLFVLNEENNVLQVSEVSFVAPNSNCAVDDFFELNDAKYGLEISQNNETKQFFTGDPIDITFYAYNKQLDNSPYKVTVEFFRANNNTVFSKTFEGKFEDCVPNVKLETTFTPSDMGKYGKRFTASYGGGEMLWGFPIVEKGATPLKQFKVGVSIDKIQCRDNFVLIQKYDESPACVTYQTGVKLIDRGWGTCGDGITHNRGHPCGPHSSPGTPSSEPQIEQLTNLTLTVSNQSFEINPVDIAVKIDGVIVIDEKFEVGNQHNFHDYEFQLEEGTHTIHINSVLGDVNMEQEFGLDEEKWGYLFYVNNEEDPPRFVLEISDKPFGFL